MEPEIILAKLESLSRCITRIEEKQPECLEILESDFDLQDIIVLNLERSVQLSVDIGLHILSDNSSSRPSSMAGVFTELEKSGIINKATADNLAKSVGFRNIAVHEYQELDWEIVWSILTNQLSDFRSFSKQVFSLLEE